MSQPSPKPRLSLADVEHVAALARLGLTDDEKQRMSEQLSSILDHISALNRLDTAAIPPTAQVIELANVMRDDVVRDSLPREDILRNAPRTDDGFIAAQAVLGGGGEEDGA
jgi:aspartyl-tRNA(Asn)/glutamyl-tRNA(Gln) amidotransferase subunit C